MKKFLLNLAVYMLFVSTFIVIINQVYIYRVEKNIYGTMGEERNDNAVIKIVPNGIKICNLGSSHGYYGFNYEDLSGKYECFNFALPSQSLFYDYRVLTNYKSKIEKGAVVFIIVSYFSFFGRPEIERDDFYSRNRRYYKFLSADLIEQYDLNTDFYVNYFPSLIENSLFLVVRKILNPTISNSNDWNKTTTASEASDNALKRAKYHIVDGRLDEKGKRIYNQQAVKALYDIIDLCHEIGAEPILITTPFLHEYNEAIERLDPNFFNVFYTLISEICKNTGITYYDYSHDKNYARNYSSFINLDHLNREGARKFTNNLVRTIKQHKNKI